MPVLHRTEFKHGHDESDERSISFVSQIVHKEMPGEKIKMKEICMVLPCKMLLPSN